MELYRNEFEKLKNQINGWLGHSDQELEATFGPDGQVDQTRFLAVAQRLKSRGYKENPPVDYLTITIKDPNGNMNIRRDTLKNNTRFTIEGSENVKEYCDNEAIGELPYEVILKSAIGNPEEDNLVIEDYDVKFKVRREQERAKDEPNVQVILNEWGNQKKAFRLIRRWKFEGDGCVFDLSMVRSNKRTSSGAYIFSETFKDPEQNILNQPATFEIEVELKHAEEINTADKAVAKLIKAVGEVLRGIQRNPVLIRKTLAKKTKDSYKLLVESEKFRGVKPRTLEMKNFLMRRFPNVPNIRDGYNVTDKADGLRVLGYCNSEGELFMIDKALNIYRTGLLNEACANSLVDGEWITSVKNSENPELQKATQQLWLFDIYIAPNKEVVDSLPFYSALAEKASRYKKLRDWYGLWTKDGPTTLIKGLQAGTRLLVNLKRFEFANKDDVQIFEKAKLVLDRKTEYNTDGLIFTSNSAPLPSADTNFKEQFKWKPAEDNTVDFLVRVEKDPNDMTKDLITSEIRQDTGQPILYKTLVLKVGSTMDPACANPRDTILFERKFPKGGCKSDHFYRDSSGKFRAVAFNPTDYADPLASICKVEIQRDPDTKVEYIQTEKSNEPIEDRSIIEMRYDMKRPDGWRWVPVRVRTDKTEKLQRGELGGSLNADFTAEAVWNSIHNPITKGMITTGNEAPLKSELEAEGEDDTLIDLGKPYFERKANKEQLQSVEGMRNYHKHYIKGETLLKPVLKGGDKYVLDLAVGEAADINRWIANNVGFVYGIDIDAKGILDSHRGAYTKYLNRISENNALPETQQIKIAPMVFGIGDVSKPLETGAAGRNEDEADILRSVFGKILPSKPVPPFIENQAKGKLVDGADVISCMFALHYFFKDQTTFDGLLKNVANNLRLNGYFVACFFDGEKVFELLKSKKEGDSVAGVDRKNALWRITKQYTASTLPADDTSFGLAIKNHFISIGASHTEYLVSYELLKAKMATIGCLPVVAEDLKELGLPTSSETFDVTYKRAVADAKRQGREPFPMTSVLRDYSFLNRWCIFKRYSATILEEEEQADMKTIAKVIETKNEAERKAEEAKTLAWQDVTDAESGQPTLATPKVPKTSASKKRNINLATLAQGPPSNKPINSLAEPLAKVSAVTRPLEVQKTEYDVDKIFYFAPQEQNTDVLKDDKGDILYPDAPRYLAPYSPFTIVDEEDPNKKVAYPSILHYYAGMQYKKATNKPEWAVEHFSRDGSIHRKIQEEMLLLDAQFNNKDSPQYKTKFQALLLKEAGMIADKSPIPMMKVHSTLKFDDGVWAGIKMDILRTAYKVRYQKDSKFRDILGKLRELEKYLLYRPTPKVTTDLGGITVIAKRKSKNQKGTVKIDGDNKLGILLMEIAKFPAYDGKIESNEEVPEE